MSADNRYTFGRTEDDYDEIRGTRGVYRIWLEEQSRDVFHTALQMCFEMLGLSFSKSNIPVQPDRPVNRPVRMEVETPRPRVIEEVAAEANKNSQLPTSKLSTSLSLSQEEISAWVS